MDAQSVVVAVMASTGLSYDDASERVTKAISRARFEQGVDTKQLRLGEKPDSVESSDEGMQGDGTKP